MASPTSSNLFPPIIDAYLPAFLQGDNFCNIIFKLSQFNVAADFNLDLAQNLTLNKPKKIRYDAYGKIISKDKKKQKVTFIDIIDKKSKFAEIIEEDDNNYNNSIKRKLSLKSLTSPRKRRSQSENFDNKVTCNACLIM